MKSRFTSRKGVSAHNPWLQKREKERVEERPDIEKTEEKG